MGERKTIVYISSSVPHSIADFYNTIDNLNKISLHTQYISRSKRFFMTEAAIVYFRAAGQSLSGLFCDEMFGEPSAFDLYRLKNHDKPRYSGTLVEYIQKVEDAAIADRFLREELLRTRGA